MLAGTGTGCRLRPGSRWCGAADPAGSASAPGNGSFSSSIEEMRVRVGLGHRERLEAFFIAFQLVPRGVRPVAISCRETYTPNSFRSSSPWPQRWSPFAVPLPILLRLIPSPKNQGFDLRDDDCFAGLLVELDPPLCRGLVVVRPIIRPRLSVGPGRPCDGPLLLLRCVRTNSKKNS